MKWHSPITSRATMAALCGIALVFGGAVHTAKAGEWDKLTIVTVKEPIQVTDTYLEPGTYVFKLADLSRRSACCSNLQF